MAKIRDGMHQDKVCDASQHPDSDERGNKIYLKIELYSLAEDL